jgi:Tfp pilus assembly protein PilF
VTKQAWSILVMLCLSTGVTGCRSSQAPEPQRYETVSAVSVSDRAAADRLSAEGHRQLDAGETEKAMNTFKDAIIQDMNCGPAHNGLGVALFRLGRYYEAAWEFDYASKLMPRSPQPLVNLGLIAEIAGKSDEAMHHYESALALEPESGALMGYLARIRIKQGVRDARTAELLRGIVERDVRPVWRTWAQTELARWPAAPSLPQAIP